MHPEFPSKCQTARHLRAEADMTWGRALSSNGSCLAGEHSPRPSPGWSCLRPHPALSVRLSFSLHTGPLRPFSPTYWHLTGGRVWPPPSSDTPHTPQPSLKTPPAPAAPSSPRPCLLSATYNALQPPRRTTPKGSSDCPGLTNTYNG